MVFWPVVLIIVLLIVALLTAAYVAAHELDELRELDRLERNIDRDGGQ